MTGRSNEKFGGGKHARTGKFYEVQVRFKAETWKNGLNKATSISFEDTLVRKVNFVVIIVILHEFYHQYSTLVKSKSSVT